MAVAGLDVAVRMEMMVGDEKCWKDRLSIQWEYLCAMM
jgi:hypothetical protein